MRERLTARQAREQLAQRAGEGVESALKRLGMSRFSADVVGDVLAAAGGVALNGAPREVRAVADVVANVAAPVISAPSLPAEMPPADQAARAEAILDAAGVALQELQTAVQVSQQLCADQRMVLEDLRGLREVLADYRRAVCEALEKRPTTPAPRKPRAPKA